MTRTQALARRTAGTLDPNCVVVVTDGPTIGTPGNTSPTEIELQPVTASDLGTAALVHTAFDNVAWSGLYDIDRGAAGTIYQLADSSNNFAEDEDENAPTVHTQFPWHRGGDNLNGNRVDSSVLIGWDVAEGEITDNTIQGSTVDLEGMTGTISVFRRNEIHHSSVIQIVSNQATVLQNEISRSSVVCQSGAQFGFLDNTMKAASVVSVDTATTGRVSVSECNFSDSYRVRVAGYTNTGVTGCNISQNMFTAANESSLHDMQCSGSAQIRVVSNDIRAGLIELSGSGQTDIDVSTMSGMTIQKHGSSSGPLNIQGSQLTNATMIIGATNNAVGNSVHRSIIRGGTFTLQGPVSGGGANSFADTTMLNMDVAVSTLATAGVFVQAGVYSRGQINQSRTAGTGSLILTDCTMVGDDNSVSDHGSSDTGQSVQLDCVNMTASVVDISVLAAGRTGPLVLTHTDMMDSVLILSGLTGSKRVSGGRMLRSNLTNAGFSLAGFSLDGMAKTLTADQTNRAGSVAFDNYNT